MYLIVGGKDRALGSAGGGCVITRGRRGLASTSDTGLPFPAGETYLRDVRNLTDWFYVHTNWDDWLSPVTHASCAAQMGNFTPTEERLCEEFIKTLYADTGKCDDLCQLYSDGRRESAIAQLTKFGPAAANMSTLLEAWHHIAHS